LFILVLDAAILWDGNTNLFLLHCDTSTFMNWKVTEPRLKKCLSFWPLTFDGVTYNNPSRSSATAHPVSLVQTSRLIASGVIAARDT
jgi:hypothetical protein